MCRFEDKMVTMEVPVVTDSDSRASQEKSEIRTKRIPSWEFFGEKGNSPRVRLEGSELRFVGIGSMDQINTGTLRGTYIYSY